MVYSISMCDVKVQDIITCCILHSSNKIKKIYDIKTYMHLTPVFILELEEEKV